MLQKILIVDDDPSLLKSTHDILAMQGYEICCAANVKQGIESALQFYPDLVVSDVMMPDGTGFEILDALRKHPKFDAILFIFMSGEAVLPQDIRHGMMSGADDYLLKPFKAIELINSVETRFKRQKQLLRTISTVSSPDLDGDRQELVQRMNRLKSDGITFEILGLKIERYERLKQILGSDKANHVCLNFYISLLHRLKKSTLYCYSSTQVDHIYLLLEAPSPQSIKVLAAQIIEFSTQPLEFHGHQLHLIPSLGDLSPEAQLDTPEKCLDHIDLAVYLSGLEGGNRLVTYTNAMTQSLKSALNWEHEIQQGMDAERFELFYQPQFELKSQRISGLEALIRFRHPEHGLISPGEFIPVAEDSGLIIALGNWVIRECCQHLSEWLKTGTLKCRVAINISLVQLRESSFIAQLQNTLARYQVPPDFVELELTESLLIEDFQEIQHHLQTLKNIGLTLAIDDFGTGYSSLYYLNQLPFDTLKIDQAFVKSMSTQIFSQAIPRAIVEMGHQLNMKILAEGIETPEQLEILRDFGCDQGQGYYLGKPCSHEQITRLLTEKQQVAYAES